MARTVKHALARIAAAPTALLRGAARILKAAIESAITQEGLTVWLRAMLGESAGLQAMRVNTAVYSGIRAIAQTVGGLPCVLHRAGDRDAVITSGPAYELLIRPQPQLTCGQFIEQWAGHLVEGGEAHLILERNPGSRNVTGLSIANRREMTLVRDPLTGLVGYWHYIPTFGSQMRIILPDENAFARLFNPYDPVRGLSPLEAAARSIEQSYLADVYQSASLKNGGQPGGLFSFPPGVTREEAEEYLRVVQERAGGASNANRNLALGGGVDYKQMAFKNTDLQLLESAGFSDRRIFNALGVPSTIVAIFESAHYDVADKSIEIFLMFTVAPLAASFSAVMNLLVLPWIEPGVECYLDLNAHPVMQRLQLAKITTLKQSIETGVPYNEAIKLVGLPLARQTWGDKSLLAAGLTPAEDVIAGPQALPAAEEPDEERPARPDEERPEREDESSRDTAAMAEQRRSEERQIAAVLPTIKRRIVTHFVQQERGLQRRLKRVLAQRQTKAAADGTDCPESSTTETDHCRHGSGTAPPRVIWVASESEEEATVRRILVEFDAQRGRLKKLVREFWPEALEKTLRAELARLGVPGERIERIVKQVRGGRAITAILRVKENRIGGIDETTRRRVKAQLLDGLRKGETVRELADRLHETLGDNRSRALTIARTEAGQAVSTARFQAAAAVGAQAKGWITGANPRPTHVQAGRDYVPRGAAIPLSEPFRVGLARLMYPRDPSGPAGEIINCNCVMVTTRRAKSEAQ